MLSVNGRRDGAPSSVPARDRIRPACRPSSRCSPTSASQDHYVGAVKGAVLAVCPRGDARGHRARAAAARRDRRAPSRSRPSYRAFPAAPCSWRWSIPASARAPRAGARGRRLSLRGARQRDLQLVLASARRRRASTRSRTAACSAPEVSATFHGRDVFGPVAGHLAGGLPLETVGPAVRDPVLLAAGAVRAARAPGSGRRSVLHVDRFGNLTTNLPGATSTRSWPRSGDDPTELVVVVEGAIVPLAGRTYADVPGGRGLRAGGQQRAASRWRSTAATRARCWARAAGAPVRLRAVSVRVMMPTARVTCEPVRGPRSSILRLAPRMPRMREVVVAGAVRTPIGRFGGALAALDRRRARRRRGARGAARARASPPEQVDETRLRLRAPGGRRARTWRARSRTAPGVPQEVPALHGEHGLRQRPQGDRPRLPRRARRRRRRRAGRRHRVDEPRAVPPDRARAGATAWATSRRWTGCTRTASSARSPSC